MDKEVILIGVGHIFRIGDKIKEAIGRAAPQAVAVELDERRFHALLNPSMARGFNIYSLLSLAQSLMAKKFGVVAGEEMMAAIEKANELSIPFYLIDMDSLYVVNKMWKSLRFKDKIKMIASIFFSLFLTKNKIKREIRKMEENDIINEIEKYMPSMKKIFIDDRNKYMAENILKLLEKYDKIVAVVGEGHMAGMKKLLEKYANVRCIHLRDYLEFAK